MPSSYGVEPATCGPAIGNAVTVDRRHFSWPGPGNHVASRCLMVLVYELLQGGTAT